MSNQPATPTGALAGQPATPAQEPAVSPAQPELTLAEQQFREFQSRADKYAKVIEDKLKQATAAFAEPATPPPAQGAPVMGGANQSPNAETQWAKNVEAVFGITLDVNDQEAALLIEGESPVEYKRNYIEALKAKKARISQAPATNAPPTSAPQPHTPTTTGGTGAPVPKPGLMDKYKAEVLQDGLTKDQKLNIRTKYRREGLDI